MNRYAEHSAATNGRYELRAVRGTRVAPTGNVWLVGTCGHVLTCVSQYASEYVKVRRMARRYRCTSCPKEA